jgi:N-acetylmuramoyl-L-alanine amidase
MANVTQLKYRLLHAAVQENVDLKRGRRPRRSYRSHRLPQPLLPVWLRRVTLATLACGLFALSHVFSVATEEHRRSASFSPQPAKATGSDSSSVQMSREREPPSQPEESSAATKVPLSAQVPGGQELPSQPEESSAVTKVPLLLTYGPRTSEFTLPEPGHVDLFAFPLAVRRIVIDPGHGGEDPGVTAGGGLREKEITLDIAQRLSTLLLAASFEVFLTREKDASVSLERRTQFANAVGGDVLVSIHINWIETRHTRGVETYYLGPTENPASLRLARVENQQSGYSVADFRRLLDGVYLDVKRGESRKLAETVQRELVHFLRKTNPTLENRSVKTAPFLVLVDATMPAILTEVSCLSNPEEARLLANSDYRQQIAQALFTGVRTYATALAQLNKKGK